MSLTAGLRYDTQKAGYAWLVLGTPDTWPDARL
jgi:hypothetical protein